MADAAEEPRSEAEVVSATISVTVGGVPKTLPVLSIKRNRTWKARLIGRAGTILGSVEDVETWAGALALVTNAVDDMLEMLLEYDRAAALGGREWLEEHATDAEIWAAFKEVARAAYPPLADLGRNPALIGQVLGQLSAKSMSSPSTSGDTEAQAS
jgi:hypothetical protein